MTLGLPPVTPTNVRPVDQASDGPTSPAKAELRTPDAPRTGGIPRAGSRNFLAGTIITATTVALIATALTFGTTGGAIADSHDVPPETQVTCPAPDTVATPVPTYITPELADASPVAPVTFGATLHETPLEGRIEQGADGSFSMVPLRQADWDAKLKGGISNIVIHGRFSPALLQDGMLTNVDLNSLPYTVRDGQASVRIDSDAHFAEVFAEGVPRFASGTIVLGHAPGTEPGGTPDHLILMMAASGPGSEMWLDGAVERPVGEGADIQRGQIHLGPATPEALERFALGDEVQINGRFAKVDAEGAPFRLVSVVNLQTHTPVDPDNIIEPTLVNGTMCAGDRELTSYGLGFIDSTNTVSQSLVVDVEQGRAYLAHVTGGDEPSIKGFTERYELIETTGLTLALDGATPQIGSDGEQRPLEILAGVVGHRSGDGAYWQLAKDPETGNLFQLEFNAGDTHANVTARMQPLDEH